MRKKLLCLVLTLAVAAGLYGCTGPAPAGTQETTSDTVNLFTWAGYIPDDVIKQFTDETGIKVNYTNFSTNEEMLSRLQSGAGNQYDVIICSDYIIETMRQAGGLMSEIDTSRLSNYKNVNPSFQNKSYDPENKYSIPFSAGSPVIVYDPEKVQTPITGYKDLWREDLANSVVTLDDARNIIGITLKKMGKSFNETDEATLNAARDELMKLKPNIKLLDANTPHNALLSGDASVGYMFASQAAAAVEGNPNLQIVYPEEGMGIGIDSYIIPQTAPHKDASYRFIDFMLDGKISAQITMAIDYQSTNTAALEFLPQTYFENKAVYIPDEYMEHAESIMDVGEAATIYDRIWTEFKAAN